MSECRCNEKTVAEAKPPCEFCKGARTRDILHRGTGELHMVRCACTHELPVKFVYQPELSGCYIAAVAMIVGTTYQELKQYVNVEHDFSCEGTSHHVANELLHRFGFAVQLRYEHDPLTHRERPTWPLVPTTDLTLCEVRNTRDSGYHAVVLLRDGRVLDPWWGVLQGLHRYPRVSSMTAVCKVGDA